jgi:hypothetical protein
MSNKFYLVTLCCIVCFIAAIQDIYCNYKKLQKSQITEKRFLFLINTYIYVNIIGIAIAYNLKTGLYSNLIGIALLPISASMPYVFYRAFKEKKLSLSKLLFLILGNIIFLFLCINSLYEAIYENIY